MTQDASAVLALIDKIEAQLIAEWLNDAAPNANDSLRRGMHVEAAELLKAVKAALGAGADPHAFGGPGWTPVHTALEDLSRGRVAQGQTAGDTSAFVLSFKRPLFSGVQSQLMSDPQAAMRAMWAVTLMVDQMAQWTVTTYQRTREEVISRQQQELLELSTPVIKLWEGVLAVPMIGTLDSSRTQLVMESLLQRIVETEAQLAIIDITGVPTVDTLVAQHLLKTVSAIRLMGADCIISGIRPQIAQTIVHLGIDLQGIASKATLADALALAMQQGGFRITRDQA